MTDFLFHKLSETEKVEIKEQAKAILDSFSKKLSRIDKEMPEPLIERQECERSEGKQTCSYLDREIMFGNAPEKNKDFIIAEKKKW